MKRISQIVLAGILTLATIASADALSAKPLRIGPVSNYGALGSSSGKVISLSTGKQVMLRGMSLYWSDATGIQYYTSTSIDWMTKNLGIDVFRFAMGIESYKANLTDLLDEAYSYKGAPESYLTKVDQMIESAIENDVYIIIDWHSHRAQFETELAQSFFSYVSQKYASIPNVIFEIYNEPVTNSWSTIQTYANAVIPQIRAYTQNLILVGTPFYSQLGSYGGIDATNLAYVFHFYAASHSVSSFGSKITTAINNGYAVFISEWGTTNADGDGAPSESATAEWTSFMETNRISNCNWSFRHVTTTMGASTSSEQSAFFDGNEFLTSQEALNNATLSTSGTLVKNYLTQHQSSWADTLLGSSAAGSCHFANTTVTETAGTLDNVLVSGCTYTSSDETVANANGSSLQILAAGYAILTGNDGSKSVVTVEKEPEQTVSGLKDFICRFGGSCSQGHSMTNYTGSSDYESILSTSETTIEGAPITFTSLTPEILTVKTGTCLISKCYSAQGSSISFVEFTTALGEGKIRVTAPAVSGYRALDDTLTVTFAKGLTRIHSKFKSQTIALGATALNALPDTAMNDQIPVHYTYNDSLSTPYFTKSGTSIIAGQENAVVLVKATTEETDRFEALSQIVTIIIGDSALAVNKDAYYTAPIVSIAKQIPFQLQPRNDGILLQVSQSGLVQISILTANGKLVTSVKQHFAAGGHWIDLKSIPTGSYLLKVHQGLSQEVFRWNRF